MAPKNTSVSAIARMRSRKRIKNAQASLASINSIAANASEPIIDTPVEPPIEPLKVDPPKIEPVKVDPDPPPRAPLLRIYADNWSRHRFKEIGRGGEAVISSIKNDVVAKVFLMPDAAEYKNNPQLQQAARIRIKEMQKKLLNFPPNLPEGFVVPNGILIKDKKVFGYTMPFIEGISLDKLCRTDAKMSKSAKKKLIFNLYDLLASLHPNGVVIGDLNENNVIVAGQTPYLIDADSAQFGGYLCRTFMPRFADPEIFTVSKVLSDNPTKLRRKPNKILAKVETVAYSMTAPHTELTDWYSFLVIVCRLLTFTDPFGGVVMSMDSLADRIANRITFFSRKPEVIYPQMARPLSEVPRPIIEVFYRQFERRERFVPSRDIFESL